jgi:hypothetical protein
MVAPRRRCAAPVRVWFDPDVNTERAADAARAACILGETVDVSRTGIGFHVPFIRLQEKYLVNQQRTLNIEIDLPGGKVYMRVMGVRYEKVGIHSSAERFLVGAHIVSLVGTDREIYENFLKNGNRIPRTTAERVGIVID